LTESKEPVKTKAPEEAEDEVLNKEEKKERGTIKNTRTLRKGKYQKPA
jgi:hypothetical protein